jgi:D-xylose transport system substrate-binding protein
VIDVDEDEKQNRRGERHHVRTTILKSALALGALAIACGAATTAGAHSTAPAAKAANTDVCVLLPDTKSSVRWELFDRPYLAAAFKKAGLSATIVNAQNDPQKMRSQADDCVTNHAKVALIVALDPGSATAITKALKAGGAKVIDYDRLTPGSGAAYYVSFDNVQVGKLQGQGLVAGLKADGEYGKKPVIAELNGDIKDNNAKLFKQGYDSVLNPLYKAGTFKKATAGDQWTEWDPVKGQTIFEGMLARNNNTINGVLAANDGLAGAVVSTLKNKGLKPIPLTGQDATPTGLQYILAGWQTGTVYKPVKLEANAAAAVAIKLIKGGKVKTNGNVSGTPSILLKPTWVNKSNYKVLFTDKWVQKSAVCVGAYKKYC